MKEEHEQWKEACRKEEKKEIQHHNRVNKSFEKIPRFDGTNPAYCFDWLMQVEALVNNNAGRNYRGRFHMVYTIEDKDSKQSSESILGPHLQFIWRKCQNHDR